MINAIDLSLAESSNKEDFIKSMNKLGYQVNWTDTRKYITYTTSEGYKCRDNKLYEEKYTKGAMENEFRRIKEKQSNSTGKSNSAISSKDGLLSNRANNSTRFVPMEYENERRYNTDEKETYRYTGKHIKGKYSNERADEKIGGRENQRSVLLSEARFERNGRRTEKENYRSKVEDGISNILGGIVAISNMVSNSQVNHKPKRRIKKYKTLSKGAMKKYAMKKANSSSFDWFEDEEEM